MRKIEDVATEYIDKYINEHYKIPAEISLHSYLYKVNERQKAKTGENYHDGEYVSCYTDEDGAFHGYPFYKKAHDLYKKIKENEVAGEPSFSSVEDRIKYDTDIEFKQIVQEKIERYG